MSPRIVLTLAFGLAGAAACTTQTKGPVISAEEARIPPAPPTPPPEAKPAAIADPPPTPKIATPVAPEQTAQGDQTQQLSTPQQAASPPAPVLGSPCASGSAGCGKSGKIAVITSFHRMRVHDAAPPCKSVQTTPQTTGQLGSACVACERVFVSSACIICRMDSESNMLGVVADMTTEQLEAAQKLAGLPAKPVLATPAAWNGAIEAAAARVKNGAKPEPSRKQ